MMSNVQLMKYKELLGKLGDSSDNHLLLGNGFNNYLGITTSYREIYEQMISYHPGYEKVEAPLNEMSVDIETLIGYLIGQIKDQRKDKYFLKNYIEQKIKLDFMKATNEIVQDSISKVYQDYTQDIYLLLKNFNNYFTLNYDPFLYLLLLKFKKDEDGDNNILAIQNTDLFQEEDLNRNQNDIYKEIKKLREDGKLEMTIEDSMPLANLRETPKGHFKVISEMYSKKIDNEWKVSDINKVCNRILKEENPQPELQNINDGFQGELFKGGKRQNVYFLHGAFHIVEHNGGIRKITAKQNKAFIRRLEEAIHSEDKDIVCVLAHESGRKREQIEENEYLKKCFNSLSEIDGSLVILGSSLDEKDQHIFDQINKSNVSNLYISSCKVDKDRDYERASGRFKQKKIALFDYETMF